MILDWVTYGQEDGHVDKIEYKMKSFKFLTNNKSMCDLDKHIAVFCPSIEMFHDFHRHLRRISGRPYETNFLHSRFLLDSEIFYFIGHPNDLNGLIFTHYYYLNFDVSENTWALEYLIERWILRPYLEPNSVGV